MLSADELTAIRERDHNWYHNQGREIEPSASLMTTWGHAAQFDRRRLLTERDALAARLAALEQAGMGLHRVIDQILYRTAQGELLIRSADDIDAAVAAWRKARGVAA